MVVFRNICSSGLEVSQNDASLRGVCILKRQNTQTCQASSGRTVV